MADLLSSLLGDPAERPQGLQLRRGIVTQAIPLLVRVGAATTAVACNAVSSYLPLVGDAVSVLVIDGDRLVVGNVGTSRPARGVLVRGFYNTADQALTVAGGQVALAGSPVNTTIAASRYSNLNVKLMVVSPSGGALRVVHYWNGVAQYTDQMDVDSLGAVIQFSTPPFGLAALTANYAVTVQALGNSMTILHSSFIGTYMWVEDQGST